MENKKWSEMTKEEKQAEMLNIAKLRGCAKSWREIAEYYNSVETTIKQAYNTFVKTTEKTERTCEDILKEDFSKNEEIILTILQKIESLELEVANIKKLQVESASIERLVESEYKYFVLNRETNKEEKFRTSEELADFLSMVTGIRGINNKYIETEISKKNPFTFTKYVISSSLKSSIDDSNEKLHSALENISELTTEITNIKNNK